MARRFLNKKTHRFYFRDDDGKRKSYVLIFGDEVDTSNAAGASGAGFKAVTYRGRRGEWKLPALTATRPTEMYFLDVGQGDAAFVVTPNNTKILVDGGLRERALGFLIWKYRLDDPANSVTIDHLFVSHADKDHVEGLIPLLEHPQITVGEIHHNGIGLFDSGPGFTTALGRHANGRLHTLHSSTSNLNGMDLASGNQAVFADWIRAVRASHASYGRLDRSDGALNVGDPAIEVEIVGPILEPDGTLAWLKDKSHTINGHSLAFRLTHGNVRTFFSGDLNEEGSEQLLHVASGALSVNAHIFKAPHHGSHEFSLELFEAVNPMLTVVSTGEVPDHGHPRANFLGAIGGVSRGPEPLLFSTELAALFVDDNDSDAVANAGTDTSLADIANFSGISGIDARQRFKKVLPGIINVRTDGQEIYAFRRVKQGYQWESYGPIQPVL